MNTKVKTVETTTTVNNLLIDKQVELEMSMRDEGIVKMEKTIDGLRAAKKEAESEYGHTIIINGLLKFSEGVEDWLSSPIRSGSGGRAHVAMQGADPKVVAFIFMKHIINSISSKTMILQSVLRSAVQQIEDEFRLEHVRNSDKAMAKRLADAANKREGWEKHKVVVNGTRNEASKGRIQGWEDWPNNIIIQIGSKLLTILMETVGLVRIVEDGTGKKMRKRLEATEETMDWITSRCDKLGLTSPLYKPMVVPPVDWDYSNLTNGVYLTNFNRPVPFVKTKNKAYFEELMNADMDVVLAAVNAMQRTPWMVNPVVLQVISEMVEKRLDWCKSVPQWENPAQPVAQVPFEEADVKQRALYAQERLQWRQLCDKLATQRTAFSSMVDAATEFSQYDRFYFGYHLDFRGRVYAVSSFNGMGPDAMKGLLQFADGKPLGEQGARWLAIHLANVGDFDKISKETFDERVKWVKANQQWIIDCAEDPWTNKQWVEADKPFQFLAAATEWKGYVEQGEGFVSHLPVALDGSCSGLQHLSMAMKCQTTAANVNILPSDKPADIYQIVADKVNACLQADAAKPDSHWEPKYNNMGEQVPNYSALAREWMQFGFSRSEAKRSVMTYSYGSKKYGFRQQIIDDVMSTETENSAKEGRDHAFSYDNGFRASSYIAEHLWDSVVSSVKRPAELMEWLTKSASLVAKSQFTLPDGTTMTLPVRWTTPLGFPVLQRYYKTSAHRVKTRINGSIIYLTMSEETKQVDSRKSAQGMSPNWVHSCDAAHLQLSVARAWEEGMEHFSLIHDSFGTHACNAGRFASVIKEAMLEMYSTSDVVADLFWELLSQVPEDKVGDLELPPSKGTLDLEAVLASEYSFA